VECKFSEIGPIRRPLTWKNRFLLAKHQLAQVMTALTARQARRILDQLTHNLTDMFEDAITRIKQQSIEESTLGMRVLAWIACSTAPLLVRELVHALSVEPGDTSLDPDGLLDPSIILATTVGLVHLQADAGGAGTLKAEYDKTGNPKRSLNKNGFLKREWITCYRNGFLLGPRGTTESWDPVPYGKWDGTGKIHGIPSDTLCHIGAESSQILLYWKNLKLRS
jgi:hypothetical protein